MLYEVITDPVGRMGAAVSGTRLQRTYRGDLSVAIEVPGIDSQHLAGDLLLQRELRDHALAARLDHIHRRVFLVGVDGTRQDVGWPQWMVRLDPFAGSYNFV